MTHKAKCIQNAKDYLTQLQFANIFSISLFEHYYRKNNGSNGNAYLVGLNAGDLMITQAKPTPADLDNSFNI